MTQQVLNLKNTNNAQIVSGTEIMEPGEGGAHTRGLTVFVPAFKSRPDITVSIYTPEVQFLDRLDRCKRESEGSPNPCGNIGHTFSPWAIEYIPQVLGDQDQITISAANAETGLETEALFLCSYVAIGVPI
jgi:hypothetical protein